MENAKDIRDWCEEQWNGQLIHSAHGNVFVQGPGGIHIKAGAERNYKSKEQKAYEARFAVYNKKLAPVILAEATLTDGEYRWPAHVKQADAPRKQRDGEAGPRRRISRVKLAQAQEILAKVPPDELAAFLARFGLSVSLAASIANLDNIEMISREFLRATL